MNTAMHGNPTAGKKKPLILCNVDKAYEGRKVLDQVSMILEPGSRNVIIGPSGSGKSTLLRILAGLEVPDAGSIENRVERVSFVFDRAGLYPALSALENIMLGVPLTWRNYQKTEAAARKKAEIFACGSFLEQKAGTLSAGQRSRIALARAMMKEPELLLLDESFASLDGALRSQLIATLLQVQQEQGFTLVCVTHSFEEALSISTHLYAAGDGKIQQLASPAALLASPHTLAQAGAGGMFGMNLMPASWFGKSGMAAAALFGCLAKQNSADPAELQGWIRVDAEFAGLQDFGWCRLAFFEKEQYRLRAVPDSDWTEDQSAALFVKRDALRFFDADGKPEQGSQE